jgi:hypothetical protein
MLTLFLLIRSMARAITVVHYNLQGHDSPYYETCVSEAFYGLPSIMIFYLLKELGQLTPKSLARIEILREGREIARADLKRRQFDAANGGPRMPTPEELCIVLESKPLLFLPVAAEQRMESWLEREIKLTLGQHIQDVLALRRKFAERVE